MGQRVNSHFVPFVPVFTYAVVRDEYTPYAVVHSEQVLFYYWYFSGGIRQRQKPQAPLRNRQTRKVANAKVRIG